MTNSSTRGMNELEFLRFDDWLKKDQDEWIVIRQYLDSPPEKRPGEILRTTCALIENNKEMIMRFLKNVSWHVRKSEIESSLWDWNYNRQELEIAEEEGTIFEPFLWWENGTPHLSTDFVIFYNLESDGKGIYYFKDEIVAEYRTSEDLVKVKTSYLRKYLKKRKMVLSRFHDHTRRIPNRLQEINGKDDEKKIIYNKRQHYKIYIESKRDTYAVSGLLGKDIIAPS